MKQNPVCFSISISKYVSICSTCLISDLFLFLPPVFSSSSSLSESLNTMKNIYLLLFDIYKPIPIRSLQFHLLSIYWPHLFLNLQAQFVVVYMQSPLIVIIFLLKIPVFVISCSFSFFSMSFSSKN